MRVTALGRLRTTVPEEATSDLDLILIFETRFLCTALAVLELALLTTINQAGSNSRDLPASASHFLGLKACATSTQVLSPISKTQ